MTRSITTKLILAFLAVSVTVVALASGITYWLTVREFKQLVFNQSRDRFVADAALYYQVNGTWDGIRIMLICATNLHNGADQVRERASSLYPLRTGRANLLQSLFSWQMPMGVSSYRPGSTRLARLCPRQSYRKGHRSM
jgi:hypothetical protein